MIQQVGRPAVVPHKAEESSLELTLRIAALIKTHKL